MPSVSAFFPPDKKIGFIGLGVSNFPLAEKFMKKGYAVSLRDKKSIPSLPGFTCFFGEHYLRDMTEDILFLAPAVRPDLPEITAAASRGVVITSEIEEFFKHKKGKTIAVTGSDGKTTTTTLIYEILKKSGVKTLLGGNIGMNLCANLENEDENTVTVCELSSFQLMKSHRRIAPDIAVITNVSPNHLDWHTNMAEYIDAKKNIFRDMKAGFCVINADDAISAGFQNEIPVPVVAVSQSAQKAGENGVFFDGKAIYTGHRKILNTSDILLPGRHNVYNYSAAIAATRGFTTDYVLRQVAKTFPGVNHRLRFTGEIDKVKYYNSSMDSSPTRTAAALSSFTQKVIVIAGGYDKKIPLESLGDLFAEKTKAVILMGDTGPKIRQILAFRAYPGKVATVFSMEEAVDTAKNLASPGDIVVLSPAAASFDMFKNFEERGERFAQCVGRLKDDGTTI